MTTGVDIAHCAALVGDPGRANMLTLLMDGRAHTASELAEAAGVTRATASGHLAQLEAGRLISVARQGRHRYFRLTSPEVATMLESLMVVAGDAISTRRATPRVPKNLREARTCYDHIAGRLGVALAEAFESLGAVVLEDGDAELTPAGHTMLAQLGIELSSARPGSRRACRACLDWSERRPHLSGKLGAALLDYMLDNGWLQRCEGTRALAISREGEAGLATTFGIKSPSASQGPRLINPNERG